MESSILMKKMLDILKKEPLKRKYEMKNKLEFGVTGKEMEMYFNLKNNHSVGEVLCELHSFGYDYTQTTIGYSPDINVSRAAAKYTGIEVITAPIQTIENFESLPTTHGNKSKTFMKKEFYIEHKKQIEEFIAFMVWSHVEVFLILLDPVHDHLNDSSNDPALSEMAFAWAMANKIQYVSEDDQDQYDKYVNFPWMVKKIKAE